jgi:acetyl-CoA decarbonylase/synthase complex subunit gamma
MSYMVPPGLYAIGDPTADSPVVVTANYKMSYDLVRQALEGRSCWLLVLETYGINVWCAAGKGTFGTGELVRRIAATGLDRVVTHRTLLLPLLGAPGVSAPEVARRSGFGIRYAAIRAADLPEFLDNGMQTTPTMRQVTFTFYERLVLIPVELIQATPSAVIIGLCLYLLGWFMNGPAAGGMAAVAWIGAVATGVVVGPLLLPWLPGRGFSVKGALAGGAWSMLWFILAGGSGWSATATVAAFLALPAVSAFYTLNFTGCTPYTSRTGVKREMRRALPAMGGALLVSAMLLVAGRFL